jgi:hypothetical protein
MSFQHVLHRYSILLTIIIDLIDDNLVTAVLLQSQHEIQILVDLRSDLCA